MNPRAIIALASCLVLAGCATGGNAHWWSHGTWFSNREAKSADKAHAAEAKAEVKVDAAESAAIHRATVEIFKASLAVDSVPSGNPKDVATRFVRNGLGLLQQVSPLTAAESAEGIEIVKGLLSEEAVKRAAAEKAQAKAEGEAARASNELAAATTALAKAKIVTDAKERALRDAFDRENALANQYRNVVALLWIAGFLIVVFAALGYYVRLQLGGVGAALHAVGMPASVMDGIEKRTSALGQWFMKTGRVAAAAAEAVQTAKQS